MRGVTVVRIAGLVGAVVVSAASGARQECPSPAASPAPLPPVILTGQAREHTSLPRDAPAVVVVSYTLRNAGNVPLLLQSWSLMARLGADTAAPLAPADALAMAEAAGELSHTEAELLGRQVGAPATRLIAPGEQMTGLAAFTLPRPQRGALRVLHVYWADTTTARTGLVTVAIDAPRPDPVADAAADPDPDPDAAADPVADPAADPDADDDDRQWGLGLSIGLMHLAYNDALAAERTAGYAVSASVSWSWRPYLFTEVGYAAHGATTAPTPRAPMSLVDRAEIALDSRGIWSSLRLQSLRDDLRPFVAAGFASLRTTLRADGNELADAGVLAVHARAGLDVALTRWLAIEIVYAVLWAPRPDVGELDDLALGGSSLLFGLRAATEPR